MLEDRYAETFSIRISNGPLSECGFIKGMKYRRFGDKERGGVSLPFVNRNSFESRTSSPAMRTA